MPDFSKRSALTELIDSIVPREQIIQNLQEMDLMNRWFRGHAISLFGMRKLLRDRRKIYQVIDLGCGSGDAMKYLADWARSKGFRIQITAVDKNEDVIRYLRLHCSDYPEIRGVVSDYMSLLKSVPAPDIVHCSLFCHHLPDEQLSELFTYFSRELKTGFVINDLRRNRQAYYASSLLTFLGRGSALSKHDGPVSVLRGFKKKEIEPVLKMAGMNNYTIAKKWPFRLLIVGYANIGY